MTVFGLRVDTSDGRIVYLRLHYMETNLKETYQAPEVQVIEVKVEGLICDSADKEGYGNAFEL